MRRGGSSPDRTQIGRGIEPRPNGVLHPRTNALPPALAKDFPPQTHGLRRDRGRDIRGESRQERGTFGGLRRDPDKDIQLDGKRARLPRRRRGHAIAGLFSFAGAAFDWEWFMTQPGAAIFVRILGRNGARILYALLGVFLSILGLAGAFGYIG